MMCNRKHSGTGKELSYQRSRMMPMEIKEGPVVSELLEIKRQMHGICVKRKAVLFWHKRCAWDFHFSQQRLLFDPGENAGGREIKVLNVCSCFLVELFLGSL